MRAIARSLIWWSITIVSLFILDDLIFGPVFWSLSVWNQPIATVMAFLSSLTIQQWLVQAGVSENHGKVAAFALKQLSLERKNKEIASREMEIRSHAKNFAGAVLVSPLIGGVVPILILNKYSVADKTKLLKFSWLPTIIYAIEFALLHGGYGIGSAVHHIFGG